MDIDALLEAFQDFERKGKKETCPVLEQFLCHIAKTGQPMIPWSQFKTYFMFKLEKVMDDFHASTPEQRGPHNPNVDYVPFEEMKMRILKIVDGYNGIPFTIQRLCELLMDPKRNYTGTDKFLMGLEKNVMVVSCVHPTSEKNGASSVNRMNGVMFPGNSTLYSDRNVNGPGTPKPYNRPKLSSCHLLSTNGLPHCPLSKEPETITEEVEEHNISESSPPEGEISPSSGLKNKHPAEEEEEEEDEEGSDADKHEAKRLKFDEKEEAETESKGEKESSSSEPESMSETPESSEDSSEPEPSGTCDTPAASEDNEPSSTETEPPEREEDSSETANADSLDEDSAADQPEEPAPSEKSPSSAEENGEHSSNDGDGPASDKQVSSSSDSSDLSTEGADNSNSPKTAEEPGEHD